MKKEAIRDLMRTLAACVISMLLFVFVPKLLFRGIEDRFLQGLLKQMVFAAAMAVSVRVLNKTWIYRSDPKLLIRGLPSAGLFYVVLFLLGSSCLSAEITEAPARVVMFLLEMLLVGYCEETMFRGLIQNGFHRLFGEESAGRIRLAAICASLLFGALHLTNAFSPEVSLKGAASQALGAAALGFYISAIYLRTGKCLWAVVLLHGLNDALAMISSGGLGGITEGSLVETMGERSLGTVLLGAAVYAGAGFFALRRRKLDELIPTKNNL